MERLTHRYVDGQAYVSMNTVSVMMENEVVGLPITKLAHYEDLGEQGKLIELPCKVGDTVYRVNNKIIPMTVDSIMIKNSNRGLLIRIDCIEDEFKGEFSYIKDNIDNDFGIRVFLTKESAAKALADMK